MVLQSLPVLITSGDLLPGGGELNGRRWAGQQLLRCWARHAGTRPMALANADPDQLEQLKPWLQSQGFNGKLHSLGLLHPEPYRAWGGFFCRILRLAVGLSGVNPLDRLRSPSLVRYTRYPRLQHWGTCKI